MAVQVRVLELFGAEVERLLAKDAPTKTPPAAHLLQGARLGWGAEQTQQTNPSPATQSNTTAADVNTISKRYL